MAENETVDDLIRFYADEAERIYAQRTRGDYTWIGLLAEFLMKVDETRAAEEVPVVHVKASDIVHRITATEVNRLAQTFYEVSALRMIPMTAKPDIVKGLRGVFEAMGIEVVEDENSPREYR